MKKVPIKIIALVAALLAIVGMFTVLTTSKQKTAAEAGATQDVVAAAQAIESGVTLTQDMLTIKKVPVSQVLPGAVLSMENAVGQVVNQRMLSGEQIVSEKLGGAGLAYRVPEGKRAFSLQVELEQGVAGLLLPGNEVDIMHSHIYAVTNEGGVGRQQVQTDYLLQKVKVCAVDQIYDTQNGGGTIGTVYATVTLELTPEQALQVEQVVTEMRNNAGNLRLTLRPQGDESLSTVNTAN